MDGLLKCTKGLQSLKAQYLKTVEGFATSTEEGSGYERLWEYAHDQFGKIDIWINNACIDQSHRYFWELEGQDDKKIIGTNLTGIKNGSHVAFNHILKQGGGKIFNMEGVGSME